MPHPCATPTQTRDAALFDPPSLSLERPFSPVKLSLDPLSADNVVVPLGSIDTSNHEPNHTDAQHVLHALADGMCGVSMVVRSEHKVVLGMPHVVCWGGGGKKGGGSESQTPPLYKLTDLCLPPRTKSCLPP